jgi:hypothetical protein
MDEERAVECKTREERQANGEEAFQPKVFADVRTAYISVDPARSCLSPTLPASDTYLASTHNERARTRCKVLHPWQDRGA